VEGRGFGAGRFRGVRKRRRRCGSLPVKREALRLQANRHKPTAGTSRATAPGPRDATDQPRRRLAFSIRHFGGTSPIAGSSLAVTRLPHRQYQLLLRSRFEIMSLVHASLRAVGPLGGVVHTLVVSSTSRPKSTTLSTVRSSCRVTPGAFRRRAARVSPDGRPTLPDPSR
jgi:hypothetical protein